MGLLGQLVAGPVAKPAPRTPSGHVLSGPPSQQHARGPQAAPNRAPVSGGSARISGPTAFPASHDVAYRRAIAETFLHQSQPTQIALIHGAMKNPTPAGTTILDFLKGTGVSKVIGHSLLYTGPGATKNVSYPYGMQGQAVPSSSPATPGATAPQASVGGLTAKGSPLSPVQQQMAQRIVQIGKQLGAPATAIQGVVFDAIFESGLGQNMSTNSSGYTGLLGGSSSQFGGNGAASADAMIKRAYQGGQGFQGGGTINQARSKSDPAVIGSQVTAAIPYNAQGISHQYEIQSGTSIDAVRKEAQAIAGAYGAGNAPAAAPTATGPRGAPSAPQAPQAPQASVFGRQIPKAQAQTFTQAQGALQHLAGDTPLSVHVTLNAATQAGAQAAGGKGLAAVIGAANAISANHYHYSWGGGHGVIGQPTGGTAGTGYDCSGAVSAILHAAGLLSSPRVAAGFMSYGQPGPGGPNDVTIYASPSHVFAKIGAKYFGTSHQNPGGGAAWFNHGYTSGFTVRHVTP